MSSFQLQSSEMLARLKPFGLSFEKSLNDLIKGIRAHSKQSPESLSAFLDGAIGECKAELQSTDLEVKATAVVKLAYLEMYGFDMSWCNFRILEVMSSAKFQQKRIGYLAATQSFKSERELLVLATNQYKKDLGSHNHVEVGLALTSIATIVTPALAQDIVDDVVLKLTHSKPYIRKKAVLALFKVFLQYPDCLKPSLPRVIEKLDDPDVAVVSATITVICEISKKNPHVFLGFLPKFFTILEDTANNWLIIRILKLFQSLSRIEPRMKKRIMPSIVALMSKTSAASLIYESINCIVDGAMIAPDSSRDKDVAKMCIDHLLQFFRKGDANLRFVGLLALIKILQVFPSFIQKNPDVAATIMHCLKDRDMIIKRKALEVCHYLATEDNIADLVKTLLLQLLPENTAASCPESFKLEITNKILEIASADNYSNVPNFKWYVTALKELANLTLLSTAASLEDTNKLTLSKRTQTLISTKLGAEFKALSFRIPSIRPYIMSKVVFEYVNNVKLLQKCPLLMKEIYWIMGEYSDNFGLTDTDDASELDDTKALSQKVTIFNKIVNICVDEKLGGPPQFPVSKAIVQLDEAEVVSTLIDATVKLYSEIVTDYRKLYLQDNKLSETKSCEIAFFLVKLIRLFERWDHHANYEIQEKALSWLEFLKLCSDALDLDKSKGVTSLETEEIEYYKEIQENSKAKASETEVEASEAEDESSDSEVDSSSDSDSEDGDSEPEQIPDMLSLDDAKEPEPQVEEVSREVPALLSRVLPSFFKSYPLNPVSNTAQGRVPIPDDLDLESPINSIPLYCLQESEPSSEEDDVEEPEVVQDVEQTAKERIERIKDDPYYITTSSKKRQSPKPNVLDLSQDTASDHHVLSTPEKHGKRSKAGKKLKKEKVVVLSEETLGGESEASEEPAKTKKNPKKNKFIIESLNLGDLDLDSPSLEDDLASKGYEYDIDLEALRSKFAGQALEKEKKTKSKKKTKKSKKPAAQDTGEAVLETGAADSHGEDAFVAPIDSSEKVVSVASKTDPAKKKKKKKAVISD